MLLHYNLQAEGYEVESASRGDEAYLRLREHVPDLVLLDWILPGISGIELCRRIRLREETRARSGLSDSGGDSRLKASMRVRCPGLDGGRAWRGPTARISGIG